MKSPKEAYNKLSKEYREKRFKNEQGFEEFINTNKDEISKTNISKYLVEQFDGYKDYVCQDQYGNIMTFSVKSMTEYEVKLDTYTIASNKFKEEYRKGDEFMKVKLNINKFMQMVNNQDYGTAANLLDQTFKKNNFANKNEFVEYIKSHMFRYNNISFKSVEKNGQLYVCEATFTDSTNGEYYKNSNQKVPQNYSWTFIVKLVDENSFVMSFTKQGEK